jgi:Pyridoxamine 5'-phosphate oxidase
MSTDPVTEQLDIPAEYGKPSKLLDWLKVRKKLEDAPVYWVISVRPDGRPHVVPRDGIWIDRTWYYGGSPKTIHNRNIDKNPNVTIHIGEGMDAIIVEGLSHHMIPAPDLAKQLADANNVKYAHYGMNITADMYLTRGTWALEAKRVIAWNEVFNDATRFTFG